MSSKIQRNFQILYFYFTYKELKYYNADYVMFYF